MDGFDRTDRVSGEKPTAPIRLSRRSAAGQNVLHPSPAGRYRVGHKPDPDRPVDTPSAHWLVTYWDSCIKGKIAAIIKVQLGIRVRVQL